MTFYSKIIATGSYLPKKILSNYDLEKMIDTTDEWILSRTGIKERRIVDDTELASDMGYNAAVDAIKSNNIDKSCIDMIIVATFTPDKIFPSNACLIQHRLGLKEIPAFDLNAVCSGFLYALTMANAYIKANMAKTILIIGADAVSHYIDYTDRNTCVLFGDGAGAVILQQSTQPGILASAINADGSGKDELYVEGHLKSGKITGHPYIYMDGKSVFKAAVNRLAETANNLLKQSKCSKEQIDWLIPHQANIRIIKAAAEYLNLPMEKVVVTLDSHGNTAAASVPLALDTAIKSGKIKHGDLLLLEGFGAGFTWGGSLIKY
ncbi:MAG: beta-ketoacyl-ACP synthase III [Neisseriaceae bacterium]